MTVTLADTLDALAHVLDEIETDNARALRYRSIADNH
jgi:hypothetical protein